jgi:flagellum-specific peptidoglycan hydrolase FlgJ
VTIRASFKDFDTPFDCVNYLVTKWYKDYRSYLGVNRAGSRQECARLLKAEGYATDPIYADKLIQIMDKHA